MSKSTCTRLFRKGVDPQLIKEQTGHKSEAVMLYKKSNLQQKKKCQKKEMEEISSPQSRILAREEMFEKKRKPSATVSSNEWVTKKAKTEGVAEKVIKEDTKLPTKEGDAKNEIKSEVKPSVTLDKNKGLDVQVPVTSGNAIDFQVFKASLIFTFISTIKNMFHITLMAGGCHRGCTNFIKKT